MVAIASGPIGWEEVRSHLLDERFEGGLTYAELIDAREAEPTWSPAQTREIVALLTAFGRKSELGPTAVVVSDSLSFGTLRILESLLDGICIVKPFLDYDAAAQWLAEFRASRSQEAAPADNAGIQD
jgi:hypothetical protein